MPCSVQHTTTIIVKERLPDGVRKVFVVGVDGSARSHGTFQARLRLRLQSARRRWDVGPNMCSRVLHM
jgi:hypothetical protein